jgi:hypothetical protein
VIKVDSDAPLRNVGHRVIQAQPSRIMATYTYKVEQLFIDQDPDLVRSYIASLITWQDDKKRATKCPVTYLIEQHSAEKTINHELIISWNIEILRTHNQYLDAEMQWLRQGGGPDGERRSEKAGMALGFIYASAVLNINPHAQKGVEVAGRAAGGTNVLLKVRCHPKKFDAIAKNPRVAEAYLSLWCSKPTVSIWEQVK